MKYYVYPATVTRIIDGDSIEVNLDLGHHLYKKDADIRLLGINTPEVRGEEKELGNVAKAKLEELIPVGTAVVVYSAKLDSFGRMLADVWIKDQYGRTVSQILVDQGYAIAWDGSGSRPKFDLEAAYPLEN